MDEYKLREVFSRGMPTVTYVGRDHLGLEAELRNRVDDGYAIIAVTGPSKCGKTVLRRKVIPDNVVIHVEGGHVEAEADFWNALRDHLNVNTSATRGSGSQESKTGRIGLSGGFPGLSGSASYSESNQSSEQNNVTFSGPQKQRLLQIAIDSNDVLVIDDFHYIKAPVRASIVRALKSAVFDGLTVVMLSVPYRAFDVLSAEEEMEGRFTHLSIPVWDENDLIKIGVQGFEALNVNPEQKILSALAKEALGSPLLMQSMCAQVCRMLDVRETSTHRVTICHDSIRYNELFEKVANDFGLPAFSKLAAGPQRRADRNPRAFANGTTGDIYEALLAAVAYAGAQKSITYDELRAALKDVLTETPPQKNEITRTIQYMCTIAKSIQKNNAISRSEIEQSALEGEQFISDVPAMDWAEDTLYLNDVFLRFYMRWIHRSKYRQQEI